MMAMIAQAAKAIFAMCGAVMLFIVGAALVFGSTDIPKDLPPRSLFVTIGSVCLFFGLLLTAITIDHWRKINQMDKERELQKNPPPVYNYQYPYYQNPSRGYQVQVSPPPPPPALPSPPPPVINVESVQLGGRSRQPEEEPESYIAKINRLTAEADDAIAEMTRRVEAQHLDPEEEQKKINLGIDIISQALDEEIQKLKKDRR